MYYIQNQLNFRGCVGGYYHGKNRKEIQGKKKIFRDLAVTKQELFLQ